MESIPESVYLEDLNRAKTSSEQLNENNNEGKEDYADIENAHEIGIIFMVFLESLWEEEIMIDYDYEIYLYIIYIRSSGRKSFGK